MSPEWYSALHTCGLWTVGPCLYGCWWFWYHWYDLWFFHTLGSPNKLRILIERYILLLLCVGVPWRGETLQALRLHLVAFWWTTWLYNQGATFYWVWAILQNIVAIRDLSPFFFNLFTVPLLHGTTVLVGSLTSSRGETVRTIVDMMLIWMFHKNPLPRDYCWLTLYTLGYSMTGEKRLLIAYLRHFIAQFYIAKWCL